MTVASLKDKVTKLRQSIAEREETASKRKAEIRDVEAELKEAQDEINAANAERDGALDAVVEQLERTTGTEFLYVLSQYSKINEKENKVLEMVSVLAEKRSEVEGFNRAAHSSYF